MKISIKLMGINHIIVNWHAGSGILFIVGRKDYLGSTGELRPIFSHPKGNMLWQAFSQGRGYNYLVARRPFLDLADTDL
jgi:hypothetical protein